MKQRLIFIDVIRAYAICMMLQGHFITALLGEPYWDESNIYFHTWHYFTGITAPVFLTISGFIFTYLLIREGERTDIGLKNPRVKKGVRRGLMLIGVACLLRKSIYFVDILHCIGLALIIMVGIYLLAGKHVRHLLPTMLISTTLILFTFNETYNQYEYSWLPQIVANYFTPKYGTLFTIFPWLGFVTLGGFMGSLFYYYRNAKYLYPTFITLLISFGLIFHFQFSSFHFLYNLTGWEHFEQLARKGFLFLRMGDTLLTFSVFVILREVLTAPFLQRIGQNTLSIYIIHSIALYHFIPHLSLDYYFHKSLEPVEAIIGAILFVIGITTASFYYHKIHKYIKEKYLSNSSDQKVLYKSFGLLFVGLFAFLMSNATYVLIGEAQFFSVPTTLDEIYSKIILYYLLPVCFAASVLLFFKRHWLFWLPYIILSAYLLTVSLFSLQNKWLPIILLLSVSIGYSILAFALMYYKNKSSKNSVN